MGLLRMATRTAVVAGTATAVSGRVARRQADRYAQPAPPPPAAPPQAAAPPPQYAPPPSAPPATAPDVDPDVARLQDRARLHGQGVLSDEEFTAAKARVLGI